MVVKDAGRGILFLLIWSLLLKNNSGLDVMQNMSYSSTFLGIMELWYPIVSSKREVLWFLLLTVQIFN